MEIISRTTRSGLLLLVKAYRGFVKPWLSPCCRYQPTCSAYAQQCLVEMPLLTAILKIIQRIASCHPFAKGGLDTVKPEQS